MTLSNVGDAAWIATRSKALLTVKDRARLTDLRGVYAGNMFNDPHLVAAIDVLLAP